MRTLGLDRSLRLFWVVALAVALVIVAPALGARFAAATGGASTQSAAPAAGGLVTVSGTVFALAPDRIAVEEDGGAGPVAFMLDGRSAFSRGGFDATGDDLRPGDRIQMTVDPRTGAVLQANATPAGLALGAPSGETAFVAALGLIAAACLLAGRLRRAPADGRRSAGVAHPLRWMKPAHLSPQRVAYPGGRARH